MEWDETRAAAPQGPKLDAMSVADLEARIQELEAEIARIRQVIQQKQAARGAAAAFFKG